MRNGCPKHKKLQVIRARGKWKSPDRLFILTITMIDTPRTVLEGAKPSVGGKKARAWAGAVGLWFYLASLGNDASLLHKPTMLRVL